MSETNPNILTLLGGGKEGVFKSQSRRLDLEETPPQSSPKKGRRN